MKIRTITCKIFSIIILLTMMLSILSGCSLKKKTDSIMQILNSDDIISFSLEDGTSRFLFGNLAETGVVRNESEATQLVQHYSDELGIKDFADNFEPTEAVNYNNGVTYRFSQKYNDVVVIGGEVSVTTDENGSPISIVNNNVDIKKDFDMTITVPEDDASSAATSFIQEQTGCSYFDIITSTNVIYVADEGEPFYAWMFKFGSKTNATYTAIVSTQDINKIAYSSNEYEAVATGKNSYGDIKSFDIAEGKGKYRLYDDEHHIGIYDYEKNGALITSNSSDWSDETEVDLITNFIRVQSFVKDKLGIDSIDNNGIEIACQDNYVNDKRKTNASWEGFYTKGNGDLYGLISFAYNPNGELPFTMCLDVCAHEYGHGLVNYYLAGYKKVSAFRTTIRSFNEAYADIFACCVDGNWTIGESYYTLVSDSKTCFRSIEKPDTDNGYKVKMPINIIPVGNTYYENSTILSHCAYNMSTKYDIQTDDLALIWINSLRFLNSSSNFQDVRDAVVVSAIQLSKMSGKIELSDKQINGIMSVFDKAGLTGNSFDELDVKKAATIEEVPGPTSVEIKVEDAVNYSKEVIADPQMAEIGWDAQGMTHYVRLPKLSSETANAKAFNQKLYDTFGEQYDQLLNNQEANHLFMCDYESKVHNGIIGIAIETNVGAQGTGANSCYYAFYYDANQDKELTFEKYLDAVGINYDLLSSRIKNTSMYKDFYSYISDYNNVYVKDCILGDDASIVYMNDMDTMMGWNRLEIESLLQ